MSPGFSYWAVTVSGPCLRRYCLRRQLAEPCLQIFCRPLKQPADDHARARRDRRSAVGHDRGICIVHVDGVVRHAERVGRDLREHRSRALTDLGAGHENARASIGERERGLRRELQFAGTGESRTVKEQRQPDPASGALQRPPFLPEVRALHRLTQHRQRAAIGAKRLAGRRDVARPKCVDLADADRIELQRLGNTIHVDFGGKLRLRRAEPAERTVRRRVRHHRAAANPHVIAAIRAARVDHAARQHDGAQAWHTRRHRRRRRYRSPSGDRRVSRRCDDE